MAWMLFTFGCLLWGIVILQKSANTGEAIGILLALLGIAMAATSFVQQLFGGPDLRYRFKDSIAANGDKSLYCEVTNYPVTNTILKLFHVTRSHAYISAPFKLEESGTQKVVGRLVPMI